MLNKTRTYDLAFAFPDEMQANPELICIIDKRFLPPLEERMQIVFAKAREAIAETYCEEPVTLHWFESDLFSQSIGINGCGYVRENEQTVSFHFILATSTMFRVAKTLDLLMTCLGGGFDGIPPANEQQQVDLMIMTDRHRSAGYGHAVGGYASTQLTNWLRAYHQEVTKEPLPKERSGRTLVEMPPIVVQAMQTTWSTVTQSSAFTEQCRGQIDNEGRFWLTCFGDACDLAIYPDERIDSEYGAAMACHNLDGVNQQLTLLAGLAKLCELAREGT